MGIHYGFNLLGWTKRDSKPDKVWSAKHKKLSKDDNNFYHNKLCWILLATDIGHVSKETIPVIIGRHQMNPVFMEEFSKKFITVEYLTKFIGYETNVSTKSNKDFIKKLLRVNRLDEHGLKNEKEIKTEFAQYCYDVHKTDITDSYSYKKVKIKTKEKHKDGKSNIR